MATDLGNLSVGLSVATSPLDLLEARLTALERTAYVARVNVDTSAVTQAEAQLASLQGAQQAMGSTATKIAVDAADVDKASISIANVRAGLAGVKGDALGAASGFEAFGPAAIAVAVVAAGMAVATVEAGKFQQQVANLQAVLHATPNDLGALSTNIQDSSKATIFTMAGVAEADRQLAKAGQDATQIMREQMDVLNLSSATQVSAAEGATAFVTSLKNFNLTATDSTMIADTLARSVDSSVGTLADMTQALQQVGPVAQNAGLDLKTTTAAIADLENAGLQGDAGTALKIFLTRLESPTQAAKAAMKDLGLQVYDTNGQLLTLSAIFDQIQQKTRGLDDETKNMDLTAIFGARGVRVADIASSQGSSGLQDVIDHENQIGGAAEIAATKLDTLQGQVKILVSSLSVLATNIGEGLLPKMTELAKAGTDITNVFANLTANVGGKQQQNSAFKDVFTAVGLDDPNAYQDQLAKIQTLKDKVADAQKQLDSFHGVRIPGISATNMSQDQLKAEIAGWNQAIDQEQALVDKAKKLQTDSPTTATNVLNANIATIINDQTSRDARSAGAPDAFAQIGQHAQDAKSYIDSFQTAFISSGHTIQEWKQIEGDAFADIDKHAQQTKDDLEQALVDLTQQNRDAEAQRALDLAHGAPERLVNTALFGGDFGLTKQQIADARAELKKWETEYTAVIAAQKQQIADEASAAKAAATAKAATETAAAQAVEQAWNAASSAVTGLDKQLDGTSAIASLTSADEQLHATQASLAALGQDSPHLDALVGLADIFKGISDATDKASAALNGYNVTLSQTNKAIQEIGSLKSEYMAALDAAQKRVANGTADASDQQIIAMRSSVFGTLDQQTASLQQAGNLDIIGKLSNLPNYSALDANGRQTIAANGGAQNLLVNVTTTADAAQQEIKDKLLQAKETQITIKTNAKEVQDQIDNIAKARTANLTIVTSYVTPAGSPVLDPTRGYGDSPPGSSNNMPPGGGGTGTPNGDASTLAQYAPEIQQAAAANNIPAWMLGALIMHESSGQAGIANSQGSGALGLTQIIPSGPGWSRNYTPEQMAMLTGNSPDAAKFQIDQGASILRDFLNNNDNDPRAALAAYGGGDPNYYDTLFNQYKAPVSNVLGMPYSTAAQGGIGAQPYSPSANAASGYGPGTYTASGGTGFLSGDATGNDLRQQIVAKAMQAVGNTQLSDELAGWCEKFIEDTLQSVTGSRGPDPGAADANAALAADKAKGLQTFNPQPGDLVYYGDAAHGHVAIYAGNGQQISTSDVGGKMIHVENVGPGAQFISSIGSPLSGYGPGDRALGSGQNPTGGVAPASGVPPNINATTGGTPVAAIIPPDFTKAATDLTAALGKLDPAAWKDVGQQFTNILPALTQMQEKKIDGGDPSKLTATDKQNALNAATEQGLRYETAYAQLVYDVENHTGNIAADTQNIANIVGGPMADGYAKAALASADMAAANAQIVQLQKDATALDEAHAAVVRQRTAEDQAASRQKARDSWAAQDAQNRLQDRQNAENVRYTQVQRDEQDKQRQLQFSQQVQATDLQNKLTDLQKQQQSTIYQRTAQEQVVAASAQGASTNAGAAGQAAILAAMHNQDLAQKDLNTKAIDDIQLQIREQAKAANLESYNLQTETIAEQRKHENAMQGFTQEGTAMQRAAQQQQRDDQIAQWQLQDRRQTEDATYADAKDANAKAQEAQKQILIAAQASLDAANQALTVWQQTGAVIVAAATSAANLPSYIDSTAQLTGVNTIRNLGGYAAGGNITSPLALVGEYGPEIIHAPGYGVIPAAKTAQLMSSAGGGSGPTVNITGDINVMAGDGDAWMAEARAKFEARLQEVKRELERKGIAAKNKNGIR